MFMHAGVVHLGSNMLYLWIFGNNIEDIMGHGKFLLFYLLCGIVATLAHILSGPNSTIPSLGASGAIAGVLGAYLVRFPHAQIDTCVFFIVITVIRLPALLVLAFWFILQLFSGTVSLMEGSTRGGTAWWAHIGGFLAGMILVNLFARRRPQRHDHYTW
jgi:membrane associated rhomboid family serine protease